MKAIIVMVFTLVMILTLQCREEFIPGKVEILAVESLTHNSVVIISGIKEVQDGVGLQLKGICIDETEIPKAGISSYTGVNYNGSLEHCLTGVSGLVPDTRYVLRAYFGTNHGYVYSDTVVIRTKSVEVFSDPRDDQSYQVHQYGQHTWMVQNLYYASSGSTVFENTGKERPLEFGRLYPYSEAVSVCPPGWHLPSDGEWKELESHIGMAQDDLDKTAQRGSPCGGMMKEPGARLWDSASAAHSTNQTGFSVVPSGWYTPGPKEFTYPGICAGFWTVSDDPENSFARLFYATSDAISRSNIRTDDYYMAVRCVK